MTLRVKDEAVILSCMARHNEIGVLGEVSAEKYLVSMGRDILDQNVRFLYGEIDIVTREKRRAGYLYHFVEVKTVARGKTDSKIYHPLQNVTREKVKRLRRAVQGYLFKHPEIQEWQFDVLCVFNDVARGKVEFELYENQVL
jgi:putative endonuclease